MNHIITLSGNSDRFTKLGYPHKALLDFNTNTTVKELVCQIPDFHNYSTFFLCREADLCNSQLKSSIRSCTDGKIIPIKSNSLGPLYSVMSVDHIIKDNDPLLITYIDSIQQFSINELVQDFKGFDSGITVHNFKNPHWKLNKSFCFVKHRKDRLCTAIKEKHVFSNQIDYSLIPGVSGSNGSYYFRSGELFKYHAESIIKSRLTVNKEYYITQVCEHLIHNSCNVRAFYCPYASIGTPAEYEEYLFWNSFYRNKQAINEQSLVSFA
jgi:NDP-sugar pyrophosphorylase family protein